METNEIMPEKPRSYLLTPGPLFADYWRFLLPDGACEIRWYGRKPTLDDVQIAIDALMLAKRALES